MKNGRRAAGQNGTKKEVLTGRAPQSARLTHDQTLLIYCLVLGAGAKESAVLAGL
jgi:hypothetical protein